MNSSLAKLTWSLVCGLCPVAGSPAHLLEEWTLRSPSSFGATLYGVTYADGVFVAVGAAGSVLTSPDGIQWTQRSAGTSHGLVGVTHGHGRFVAVGEGGAIVTSPDGIGWTARNSGTIFTMFGVAYGNERFVAVAEAGQVLTSADGVTWSPHPSGKLYALNGVTYGEGLFVAVGGSILSSPDGVNWTRRTAGLARPLNGVAYGGGGYVAVGFQASEYTSTNGVNWTKRIIGLSYTGVGYGGGYFVAVGGGPLRISADGHGWSIRNSGLLYGLSGVGYGKGTFVVVGGGGRILQSASLGAEPFRLTEARLRSGRQFEFVLDGEVGARYEIQVSADLIWWRPLTNLTLSATNRVLVDSTPADGLPRFYRGFRSF